MTNGETEIEESNIKDIEMARDIRDKMLEDFNNSENNFIDFRLEEED